MVTFESGLFLRVVVVSGLLSVVLSEGVWSSKGHSSSVGPLVDDLV